MLWLKNHSMNFGSSELFDMDTSYMRGKYLIQSWGDSKIQNHGDQGEINK